MGEETMNCLCCGKLLNDPQEKGWHRRCVKRFFGTASLPELDINDEMLEQIAMESVTKGLTVPGVQKKLSLHLFSEGMSSRLTLVDYPAGYILKPQVGEYPFMPESEQLVMSMADICGIKTVPHALLRCGIDMAYITKRVDRRIEEGKVFKLAMEDFCQLEQRLTMDKYKGSYERCSGVISRYSSRSRLDQTEFFLRVVFCFVTGNSDMHLKNFSLMETAAASGEYYLSPAYDLLPVNLLLPEDKEETALTLNGRKNKLRKKDFICLSSRCGIADSIAEKLIKSVCHKKERLLLMCDDSFLPVDMRKAFKELITKRCDVLL